MPTRGEAVGGAEVGASTMRVEVLAVITVITVEVTHLVVTNPVVVEGGAELLRCLGWMVAAAAGRRMELDSSSGRS